MTALTTARANGLRSAAGAPPRRRDLLGAEWIKLWSLRSTLIVLTAAVVLARYVAYDGAHQAYTAWPGFEDDFEQIFDPGHETLCPPAYLLLMTVAGAIGAQTVVGEHANGLIRTTFIAVPARSRVVPAKAVVVAAVPASVGLLVGVGSWTIAMAVYADRITAFTWSTPGLPGLLAAFEQVSNALPFSAFLQLTHLGTGHIMGHHPSDTEAWIALPAWGLAACAVAVTALRRRDV